MRKVRKIALHGRRNSNQGKLKNDGNWMAEKRAKGFLRRTREEKSWNPDISGSKIWKGEKKGQRKESEITMPGGCE